MELGFDRHLADTEQHLRLLLSPYCKMEIDALIEGTN